MPKPHPITEMQPVAKNLALDSRVLRVLCMGCSLRSGRQNVLVRAVALCRIDVEGLPPAGPGDLRWFLTPKIMRAMRTHSPNGCFPDIPAPARRWRCW